MRMQTTISGRAASPKQPRGSVIPLLGLRVSCLALGLAGGISAIAQPSGPHIGYVFPAGGRIDSSFKVSVGGQFLGTASNAFFSGAGITAKVEGYTRPLTQKEFNNLREKLSQLQEKRAAASRFGRTRQRNSNNSARPAWTAADEEQFAKLRDKLLNFAPRRQGNPAIAETVVLHVTVSPDAEPGNRELRLATPFGLSNPLLFKIGDLPEFTEKEAPVYPELEERRSRFARPTPKVDPAAEMSISLPAAVNGQIMPGDVDRYRFRAREGMRLVVAASARELIPYLPDAVPGWFQATLALYDAKGNELAYDDDFMFNPDPVLFYRIPKDGEYVVEIKDSIYRGREDFVYRLAIGELQFITGVFPLGGQAGVGGTVELTGHNLPVREVKTDFKETGAFPLPVKVTNLLNAVSFAVDTLAEVLESEPGDVSGKAQLVTLPVIVNGRIERPGDVDVFQFEGGAGQEVVLDVQARRLNSPLDSFVRITDAAGNLVASNDDCEDKGDGLKTHHADSYLIVKLPATGTYTVSLSDTQQKGGRNYAYRLRLGSPRPDFELRVVPSQVAMRGGATVPLTVYALRRDGFKGDINLSIAEAPEGFRLGGAKIPAGQEKVQITLTAPPTPTKEPINLQLQGTAVAEGNVISRAVVPAEDLMQAFFYRHLVPAQEMKVAVSGRWMSRGRVSILGEMPVKIPVGGTARVQVSSYAAGAVGQFQLELDNPPEGISIQKVNPGRSGAEIVLECDEEKCKPGVKGNLIVNAFAARSAAAGKNKNKNAPAKKFPIGTLPAIPFEIVGQ